MKTTIDAAGRIVIPKKLREEAGFQAGMELEVRYCNGQIELEPTNSPMRLERRGRFLVAVPDDDSDAILTAELVAETLRQIRDERELNL